MKRLFTILVFCAFLFSCEDVFDCTKGEGPIVTRNLELSDFNSIKLSGSDKLYIRQGPVQEVTVEGQDNIINLIETTVRNGHWNAHVRECVRKHADLVFYVTIPDIKMLSVAGSGKIIGEDILQVENLKAHISGSGKISAFVEATTLQSEITGSGDLNLEGTTNESAVKITGSGKFHAYNLQAIDCTVNIKGSGDAFVTVSDYLDIKISGSGKVLYKGNPIVTSSITGSGSVKPVD